MKSKHAACRLPAELGEKLDEAEAERGNFRSEILRAALRHYIRTNPDGYVAFRETSENRPRRKQSGRENEGHSGNRSLGIYDPTQDGSE